MPDEQGVGALRVVRFGGSPKARKDIDDHWPLGSTLSLDMNDSGTHSEKVLRRMPIGQHIIWMLTAISLAWYAWSNHKVLKEYRRVRDNFHMTDAEMADFAEHHQEYFDAMKRQDEMAAVIALAALVKLDGGDIEKAKSRLQTAIAIYYRGHRDDGDSNVLRHITAFAATNAALSNAIYRKLE